MRRFTDADPFFLQWHVTDRCNLACAHCYRDRAPREPTSAELRSIWRNFLALRDQLPQARVRVQLAGGEPLAAEHIWEVLALAAGDGVPVRLLSNGTLVTAASARRLKTAGCRVVQVSIDGDEAAHDARRGAGSFRAALAGIRRLRAAGIEVTVAMTLARDNLAALPAVLDLAAREADRFGAHRLVPCGRAADAAGQLLAPAELRQAYDRIAAFRAAQPQIDVPRRDPLWQAYCDCPHDDGKVAGCSAGWGGICIDTDGTVTPCRRLPVALGNALRDDLTGLWCGVTMARLRARDDLRGRCGACDLRWRCGGCRAIARAVTGDMLAADPQCFYRPSRLRRGARRVSRALHAYAAAGE